jgi:hypothetical protein
MTEMTLEQREEQARLDTINLSRETCRNIIRLVKTMSKDLASEDVNIQQGAVLAIRAFDCFVHQPEGFKAWFKNLKDQIEGQQSPRIITRH